MSEPHRAHFCIECGSQLEIKPMFGKDRPACPICGHVHFDDPKVAVGVIAERNGQILLTRRNHEPKMGCWSFPSGFVDAGELLEDAARREAFEETGISVDVQRLLGVYQESGSAVIFIAFAALAGEGVPVPDVESMEVRFFPVESLPELAFVHDDAILETWRAVR